MSPRRTIAPSDSYTTSSRNSSGVRRSVRAVRSTETICPRVDPSAASTLLDCSAPCTSLAVTPSAFMRSGFNHTRIANAPVPMISARCTPATVASRGSTTRIR